MGSEDLGRLDPTSGIDALAGLIEKAQRLLKENPVKLPGYARWNQAARDCLIGIYGPESPNVFSIVECACGDAAWSDMTFGNRRLSGPEKITASYAAACLEARSRHLANCIAALKAKLKEPAPARAICARPARRPNSAVGPAFRLSSS